MKLRPPSVGFIAVCLVYGASASFFAWGMTPPPLDRIWMLDHRLKIGDTWALSAEDRELVQRGLIDYPGLASALLSDTEVGVISAQREGWVETPEVTVIRSAKVGAKLTLELDVQTPPKHLPLKVTIKGHSWKTKLQIDAPGSQFVELPPTTQSELITIDFKGKELRADPSILRTRVSFHQGRVP